MYVNTNFPSINNMFFMIFIQPSVSLHFITKVDMVIDPVWIPHSAGCAGHAVFPHFIFEVLPPGVAGLVTAGVFAAAMSTMDSSLNAVSSVVVTDVVKRCLAPDLKDRQYLRIGRGISIGAAAMMVGMALVLGSLQKVWAAPFSAFACLPPCAALFGCGVMYPKPRPFDVRRRSRLYVSIWLVLSELRFCPGPFGTSDFVNMTISESDTLVPRKATEAIVMIDAYVCVCVPGPGDRRSL